MLAFVPQYLFWHYTRALREMFAVFGNFFWFLYHFFSIPLLLKTFFSPFERLGEEYKKGLNMEALLGTFVINMVMRIVGIVVRALVVLAGFSALLLLCLVYAGAFLVWLAAPLLVPFLLIAGFIGV